MTYPNHMQHAATLHDYARRESHPDSEEAVQIERQRVARELQPYYNRSRTTSRAPSHDHSRSRQSIASNAPLQDRDSLEGHAATLPDATRSERSSVREVLWYSPVVKFWTTHVRHVGCYTTSTESANTKQSHDRRRGSQRPSRCVT